MYFLTGIWFGGGVTIFDLVYLIDPGPPVRGQVKLGIFNFNISVKTV